MTRRRPASGVPYPGTFVLDRITARDFETACQERSTVPSIVVREGSTGLGAVVQASTAHLTVVATAGDGVVTPGNRVTLTFDITPARDMHVYAPGGHTYRVIAFHVDLPPWLTVSCGLPAVGDLPRRATRRRRCRSPSRRRSRRCRASRNGAPRPGAGRPSR